MDGLNLKEGDLVIKVQHGEHHLQIGRVVFDRKMLKEHGLNSKFVTICFPGESGGWTTQQESVNPYYMDGYRVLKTVEIACTPVTEEKPS